ncbi:hypothetical protein EW145_g5077 [Phellinidium pouzarii]|uniref:CCZ1/INTU/HSP4 first Longin domain-containing protein n=1 Tax=Phellinidium pouzarii TaxID=167371 RepID=A0A4V6S154_9AGAM|nr:hypothetical protein EW145_g5077 [Phellinidium pouzarii]
MRPFLEILGGAHTDAHSFVVAATSALLMNRLPPSLLYLVIYNPTLKSSDSAPCDDEDTEEQMHVLFYTANDHAVSRDRVLRQVGLAKALVNFTTIFDSHNACESVHSQGRRMFMVSPEPNFWIHACFELERTPRIVKKDEKGKHKLKETVYDYNETSLHDTALRTRLLRGYEAFKVTHGSFSSILNTLGKEALELQLERFFTVWSWNLDFSKQLPYVDYLGIRVHPLSNQLTPLVDALQDKLPPNYSSLVVVSSCIVATKSLLIQHPSSLIRHLLSIAKKKQTDLRATTNDYPSADIRAPQSSADATSRDPNSKPTKNFSSGKSFLGASGFNMNVNMDIRKWNWHDYLTFGLGSSASEPKNQSDKLSEDDNGKDSVGSTFETQGRQQPVADMGLEESAQRTSDSVVDSLALEDALTSDDNAKEPAISTQDTSRDVILVNSHSFTDAYPKSGSTNIHLEPPLGDEVVDKSTSGISPHTRDAVLSFECNGLFSELNFQSEGRTSYQKNPGSSFSESFVHLTDSQTLVTHRRLLRYIRNNDYLIAVIPALDGSDDALDRDTCERLAKMGIELMERLKETVDSEQEKITAAFSSSPVQSVLQKSQHVVDSPNQLTYSSTSFSATSWHFHEGKRVLELDQDILEIYSRGQSPQDWHLVKRGVSTGAVVHGDVYMEIRRKEASLVDVDNEVAGVIRRSIEKETLL